MDTFPTFLVILIAIIIIVSYTVDYYMSLNFSKKTENNFKELARRLGLNLEIPIKKMKKYITRESYPKLYGSVNEYDFQLHTRSHGSGKSQTIYTSFDIHINYNSSHNLIIFNENYLSKFSKMLGIQKEIEVDDPEFDRLFIVKSDNEHFAKTILSDMVLKNKIIKERHLLPFGEIIFENGILHVSIINSLYDNDEINDMERLIKIALLLADRIKSTS